VSGAVKRFSYILDGAENNTFLPVKKSDSFMGWNVGVKYDVTDRLYAKTSYERGFLIPYFEQFVGDGGSILRNTSLLPESSDNVNLGLGYTSPAARKLTLTTNINAFYREQYDIIFINSTRVVRRYENTDQVRTTGAEGEVVMVYNKNWTWRNNVTWLRKTYTHIKDPLQAELLGTAFPNNPSFYANTELSWQKAAFLREADQFRVYTYYQYVAPFNYGPIGQDDNYQNRKDLFVPTQHRLDVGASYRFAKRHVTAAFNVINLLDAELYDNFKVPRAGINVNAKLIFEIKNLRKP
jgi:outer membrane receptor protein involved in Fe transport